MVDKVFQLREVRSSIRRAKLMPTMSPNTNSALNGGGIYNQGTLTLNEGSSVYSNMAHEDGGGIYNEGTLYLCGGTVDGNQAPRVTEDNISGNAALECPAAPPPEGPGPGEKGGRILVNHKGKELCLPEAALNGHLNHGDKVIDEEGCSDETPSTAATGA
jgi:hypothetical protein